MQFVQDMLGALSGFKVMFGTSTRKLLGWGPSLTHKNDILCIIIGAMTSFLLRPVKNDRLDKSSRTQRYRLVGECYVQGLMNGEGLVMGRRQRCVLVYLISLGEEVPSRALPVRITIMYLQNVGRRSNISTLERSGKSDV